MRFNVIWDSVKGKSSVLRRIGVMSLLFVILLSICNVAFAATGATVILKDGTKMPYNLYNKLLGNSVFGASSFSPKAVHQTTFDIGINYHDVVSDDVYINAQKPKDKVALRNRALQIEEVIKYFAQSLYESSNGRHYIGRVRIYQNKKNGNADIQWIKKEHPSASAGGYGYPSLHISMGDKMGDTEFVNDSSIADNNRNIQVGGFTLAHEAGHYIYALFDEYQLPKSQHKKEYDKYIYFPRLTDTAPRGPSIMHDQSEAISNIAWLNYSTRLSYRGIVSPDNAQFRTHKKSGWETLTSVTSYDAILSSQGTPRAIYDFGAFGGTHIPESVYKSDDELGEDILNGDNLDYKIEGLSKQGERYLDIRWIPQDAVVVHQIVIDVSGSMAGTPLSNAKKAAKAYVNNLPSGAKIGIVAFNHSYTQVFPITQIDWLTSWVTKWNATSAIDKLSADGATALYDAILFALTNMESLSRDSSVAVTLVISDGEDNSSSSNKNDVLTSYNARGVKIRSIAYGGGADFKALAELAEFTGGKFYSAPTSQKELQSVLLDAQNDVSGMVSIGQKELNIPVGVSQEMKFMIDDTMGQAVFMVSHSGLQGGASVVILSPSGSAIISDDIVVNEAAEPPAYTSYTAFINSIVQGEWTVKVVNKSEQLLNVNCSVNGTIGDGVDGFSLGIEATRIEDVQLVPVGAPEMIRVFVKKGGNRLTGIDKIKGVLYDSDMAKVSDIEFIDNGNLQYGDVMASDGLYSAMVTLPATGTYTIKTEIDVFDASVMETRVGALPSIPIDPNYKFPDPLGEPFKATFSRTAMISLIANESVLPRPLPIVITDGYEHEEEKKSSGGGGGGGGGGGCNAGAEFALLVALSALPLIFRKKK